MPIKTILTPIKKIIASPKKSWVVFIVSIVVVLCILQLPHIHDNFLSDDYDWIHNARVRVENSTWLNSFQGSTGGNFYRPLPAFSFEVDYALWGYNTAGYHAHQLVFHALCVIGIAFLLWQIFRQRWLAFGAAFLFAVYPSHHEVVTWIAGRPDLYAVTFSVFALAFFAIFIRKRNWIAYGAFLLCAAAAFLSKEIAFTLPALAVLAAIFILPLREWKRILIAWLWIIPIAALLIGVLVVRNHILADPIGGYIIAGELQGYKWSWENVNKMVTAPLYLINLSYAAERFGSFGIWLRDAFLKVTSYWAYLVAATLALEAGIYARWRNREQLRLWLFGFAWSLITFIPVFSLSGFIATNLTASRLFFMSSIGYTCLVIAYLWPLGKPSIWRIIRRVGLLLVCFVAVGLWLFNSIPWKTATQQVGEIRSALTKQRQAFDNGSSTIILASKMPVMVHGAYMYFGNHSLYETMYELTKNVYIKTFMVGSRRFYDSPLCTAYDPNTLRHIEWNAKTKQFDIEEPAQLEQKLSQTAQEPLVWNFSDPDITRDWRFEGMNAVQQADGVQLTTTRTSKVYAEVPTIAIPYMSAYKTIIINFSPISMTDQRAISIQWAGEDDYSGTDTITEIYGAEKNIQMTISTCQYMNWMLSENTDRLRFIPLQHGTFVLHSISLNP